jgi:hypothetical protein
LIDIVLDHRVTYLGFYSVYISDLGKY